MKTTRYNTSKKIVMRIKEINKFIVKGGMLRSKYMIGFVNGMRLIQSEIDGDEPIFERPEAYKRFFKIRVATEKKLNRIFKTILRKVLDDQKSKKD